MAATTAATPTPTITKTATATTTIASVDTIDTLKEQLIWSQKQELDRLRLAFDSQKEMIAIQQQQIEVLEANMFAALLRANSHIYLQPDGVVEAVENSYDNTPEQQQQQPTRDDVLHPDEMDDAVSTAEEDIHHDEDEEDNNHDPDEQQEEQNMAYV